MLSAGTHLGPYQVLGPLGAGGMGEVYRARDSRLERDVAIKVLPDHLADDPTALARFEREARAVAALSHPNILGIHDFGTQERTVFAVMELLEGGTLRGRLAMAALPWRAAVEIGAAIADGLRAAHAKGITHRDLKPENVFLTADGRVKILDFGLARVDSPSVGAATQSYHSALTDPGMIMGTVGYMSPEQVRGQEVDTRSDLFSLGCVLYEMVTGQRAFARASIADTMAAILYDDLPEPVGPGKWMPPELDRVIRHCLEKSPEERFHSARDLAFALRTIVDAPTTSKPIRVIHRRIIHPAAWIAVAVVSLGVLSAVVYTLLGPSRESRSLEVRTTIQTLAVLPFVYQGGDADGEFLVDGVPMSLISSLAGVGELQVRPFGSVSSYKGETVSDPAGVGRKLGVQTVLTGTVRKRGDELFISCELVDVRTNSVLPCGEPYRRKLEDLFAVQEELAHAIADQLRLQLSGEARRELAKRPTEDREAYRLYVLGRREWDEHTEAGFRKSIVHYQQAIKKDPNYALAYSGIADSYIQLGFEWLPPNEAFRQAKTYAEKAVALDPALAEARVSLGTYYLLYDRNWPAARRELDLAIAHNRNYPDTYHFYCHYFQIVGSMADAIAMMKRSEELDPTSAVVKTELAWSYYVNRDYDQAIRQYLELRRTDPSYVWMVTYLAQAYEQHSMNKEAIEELKMLRDREKNWPAVIVELGYAYAASGRSDELRTILKELKELSAHRYISPYYMAAIFVAQGDHDEAINWLRTAVAEHDPNIPFLKVEPKFDGLRSDPRYAEVLRSVGLPQ